jgi:hypothetical protein
MEASPDGLHLMRLSLRLRERPPAHELHTSLQEHLQNIQGWNAWPSFSALTAAERNHLLHDLSRGQHEIGVALQRNTAENVQRHQTQQQLTHMMVSQQNSINTIGGMMNQVCGALAQLNASIGTLDGTAVPSLAAATTAPTAAPATLAPQDEDVDMHENDARTAPPVHMRSTPPPKNLRGPTKFTGEDSRVMAESFLWELHMYLKTAYPQHRHEWAAIGMQFLKGAAHRHYTAQVQHYERMARGNGMPIPHYTWEMFCTSITDAFPQVNQTFTHIENIMALEQGGKSLQEYTNEFMRAANLCIGLSDSIKIQMFLKGMEPYAHRVLGINPSTSAPWEIFTDLTKAAIAREQTGMLTRTPRGEHQHNERPTRSRSPSDSDDERPTRSRSPSVSDDGRPARSRSPGFRDDDAPKLAAVQQRPRVKRSKRTKTRQLLPTPTLE